MMTQSIYQAHGYESRMEYLQELAEEYDMPLEHVVEAARMLGPAEDFDGLVAMLQDYAG